MKQQLGAKPDYREGRSVPRMAKRGKTVSWRVVGKRKKDIGSKPFLRHGLQNEGKKRA